MNDPLEIPEELQHLVEKRSESGRRKSDGGNHDSGSTSNDGKPAVERRKQERRKAD